MHHQGKHIRPCIHQDASVQMHHTGDLEDISLSTHKQPLTRVCRTIVTWIHLDALRQVGFVSGTHYCTRMIWMPPAWTWQRCLRKSFRKNILDLSCTRPNTSTLFVCYIALFEINHIWPLTKFTRIIARKHRQWLKSLAQWNTEYRYQSLWIGWLVTCCGVICVRQFYEYIFDDNTIRPIHICDQFPGNIRMNNITRVTNTANIMKGVAVKLTFCGWSQYMSMWVAIYAGNSRS